MGPHKQVAETHKEKIRAVEVDPIGSLPYLHCYMFGERLKEKSRLACVCVCGNV